VAFLFERVAIVGVGLIGGSLSLAAKRAGLFGQVVGVGRGAANLAVARERGIADRTTHELADIGPVDLVVLGVPVNSVEPTAVRLVPHLRAGTVVTDVASVKGPVVEAVEPLMPAGCAFVGAHPIAGSERSGSAAASADLFGDSRCVLTPTPKIDLSALARIETLWHGVGAEVQYMTPARHDQALAWTSHLTHAIAYTLTETIAARDADLFLFGGPSLRDATRVASSAPLLWRDILLANADPIADVMREFGVALEDLREAIAARDEQRLMAHLEAGYAARRKMEELKR
jgi:prephenate dehydrogenase